MKSKPSLRFYVSPLMMMVKETTLGWLCPTILISQTKASTVNWIYSQRIIQKLMSLYNRAPSFAKVASDGT